MYDKNKSYCMETAKQVFETIKAFFIENRFAVQDYKFEIISSPHQPNDFDCRVFICFYALHSVMEWFSQFDKVIL